MKRNKPLVVVAVAAVIGLSSVLSGHAQSYPAFLSAINISTNRNGLTYHFFGNHDLINQCASELGVTNRGLKLVYDRAADALHVVDTNHTVLCTPLTFSGGLSLTNTNNTTVERLAFVFVETNLMSGGTLAATERIRYDTNGVVKVFSLTGKLDYSNGGTIIRGSLTAGTFFSPFYP